MVSGEKDKVRALADMMKIPPGPQYAKLDKKYRELLVLLKEGGASKASTLREFTKQWPIGESMNSTKWAKVFGFFHKTSSSD